jgi:hypothetical protein
VALVGQLALLIVTKDYMLLPNVNVAVIHVRHLIQVALWQLIWKLSDTYYL